MKTWSEGAREHYASQISDSKSKQATNLTWGRAQTSVYNALINWCWLWSHCTLPVNVAPSLDVTFDLSLRPLHWPGRDSPVLFSQLRTWVELRRGFHVCERLLIVWIAPPTQEVGCVVVVECHRLGVLYDFWSASSGCSWRMGLRRCGRVLVPPFWPSFRSIEYALAAVGVIEWEWATHLRLYHLRLKST